MMLGQLANLLTSTLASLLAIPATGQMPSYRWVTVNISSVATSTQTPQSRNGSTEEQGD